MGENIAPETTHPETVIRFSDGGKVWVERTANGIKSVKQIDPDSLLKCIRQSLLRGGVSSGLLPSGCLSFTYFDDGGKDVCLLHQAETADLIYYDSVYKNFPLPKLVFGFCVSSEGRVSSCRMGIVANDPVLKPNTLMYHYPLSNVSGFNICTGNNALPRCGSLHTLRSLPYHILAMPNNDHYFSPSRNKPGMGMRDLLEQLKDKTREYYYSDILIPSGAVLGDFIGIGGDA